MLGLCIFILLQIVGCQDIITTIAGTGTGTYSGDNGAATSAGLDTPAGVALDTLGLKSYKDSFFLLNLILFLSQATCILRIKVTIVSAN